MISEEFKIWGLLPEDATIGQLRLDELKSLISDHLKLEPLFSVIEGILRRQIENEDELKQIDIHKVFKVMHSPAFLKGIPPFVNSRTTESNIKVIRAALVLYSRNLLTMPDIRDGVMIFSLKEMENMTIGVPCDSPNLFSLLWKINKTMSSKIMEEWIKRSGDFLEIKGVILCNEFLYLLSNATNRRKFFDKIPKIPFDISRNPKTNLFYLDQQTLKNSINPDVKIQNYMTYQYNMDKAIYEGVGKSAKDDPNYLKRKHKFEEFLNTKSDNLDEFKKLLRDPELYVEIKSKIKNANQFMNHSKLNGKSMKFQIMREIKESKDMSSKNEAQLMQMSLSKFELVKKERPSKKLSGIRPETAKTQVSQEVKFHRELAKEDPAVYDQFYSTQQTSSSTFLTRVYSGAWSRGTTANSKRNVHFSQSSIRQKPTSARSVVSQKAGEVMSAAHLENILDDELFDFENKMMATKTQSGKTYYGSNNTSQGRPFLISGVNDIIHKK